MGGNPKLKNCKFSLSCKKDFTKKVEIQGGNIFMSGSKGGLASGSRKDLKENNEVKKIIDGCFIEFSRDLNDNNNTILPTVICG